MSQVPAILRMRHRRATREQRSPLARLGLSCSLLAALFAATFIIVLAGLYANITHNLPSLALLPELLDPPDGLLFQPTRLYDRSGEHVLLTLENPAVESRLALTLDPAEPDFLPANLISATLVVVEPNFWNNPLGISLTHNGIAKRLASDFLLADETPGLRRELRLQLLSLQLTLNYGHERLLAWYLNSAYYGRLAVGAQAAARVYFNKPASQLTLSESAILAATAEAPALNPLDAPQAARERGLAVLRAMQSSSWITSQQASAALQELPSFATAVAPEAGPAPVFARLVIEQLSQKIGLLRIERGGLQIITTLDYELQLQTECAAKAQLARLQGHSLPASDDSNLCPAARLLPPLPDLDTAAFTDLSSAAIVYHPRRGEILALTGDTGAGLDPTRLPFRPPGTLLTPLVTLTAFTRGLTPASLVWDISAPAETVIKPGEYHGPMRLRIAQANDYLAAMSQVMSQTGAQNVWRTAQQLGLDLGNTHSLDLAGLMESREVSLLQLAQAYGAIANQGILVGQNSPANEVAIQPITVLQVLDYHGRILVGDPQGLTLTAIQKPLLNPQLAYLLNHTLSDEPARWPSLGYPNPLEIGRPAAAKLGYTRQGKDAWALGYTPSFLTGVWIGYRDPDSPGPTLDARLAAGAWHAIMQYSLAGQQFESWAVPVGINRLEVCELSGLLPTEACPNKVTEIFLAGTEPTQADNLFQIIQTNRETGRLATVFTPPELVERRTYLIVPPEARSWALQAGIPLPPETYDLVQTGPGETNAQITSPEMFAYVRGEVTIRGTAGGDNFAYYQLQVGQGLNPERWLQISEPSDRAVYNDVLAEWDATELEGLYAIQLLVVDQAQRVATAVTQVAVDNQAPELEITSLSEGEELPLSTGSLVFTARVNDNLALQAVSFSVDGKTLVTVPGDPYSAAWTPTSGHHTLTVQAVDQAGNRSQQSLSFKIIP